MSVTTAVVGLSAVTAAVSVGASVRARRAAGGDSGVVVLVAGGLLALVLVLVDHHAVLSWSFGVGTGEARALLPGVGVALGVALLAATGGTLLLGGGLAAPAAAGGASTAAKGALWVAVVAGASGVGLAVVRLLAQTAEPRGGGWSVALIAAATAGLALSLLEVSAPTPSDPTREAARAALFTRVAAALAVVAAIAAGAEGWWREGTYATGLTAAVAATALLGLAVPEPLPRLALPLRVMFLLGLLGLLAG